jgi:phage terminase small subunit
MSRPKLSEVERRFADAYMVHAGEIKAAATEIGISPSTGYRLAELPRVQSRIAKIAESDPLVATREERQKWWTAVMRDPELDLRDRMKASDMLAKSQGDYTIKIEAKIEHVDVRAELEAMLSSIRKRVEVPS